MVKTMREAKHHGRRFTTASKIFVFCCPFFFYYPSFTLAGWLDPHLHLIVYTVEEHDAKYDSDPSQPQQHGGSRRVLSEESKRHLINTDVVHLYDHTYRHDGQQSRGGGGNNSGPPPLDGEDEDAATKTTSATMVSVFLEAYDPSAIDALKEEGCLVRTTILLPPTSGSRRSADGEDGTGTGTVAVTADGQTILPPDDGSGDDTATIIVTADVPVHSLVTLATWDTIGLVEAARPVTTHNDVSNGMKIVKSDDVERNPAYVGMNNTERTRTGNGVIVGVVDTGIDWTHKDFIDANGRTRVLYYWDHSDWDEDVDPPRGAGWSYTYGHEYTAVDINAALRNFDNSWDPKTNSFAPVDDPDYPIKASARDSRSGHGTHVAGTAAGNGRGSNMKGAAPDAYIIAVKWDSCGKRNPLTYVVDGINYIFKRAEELGMPAVVNLSLGNPISPHDGTTLAERAMNSLIGRGRIVVASSGNSGRVNHFEDLNQGFSLHGSGKMNRDAITLRIPDGLAEIPDGYPKECGKRAGYNIMFDIWYSGQESCKVRVTSPTGIVLPSSLGEKYAHLWVTETKGATVKTDDYTLWIKNGGHVLRKGHGNSDNELVIYLTVDPLSSLAKGTWFFEILGLDARRGDYHAWYLASDAIVEGWKRESHPREPTPKFGGRFPDNSYTVKMPGTADRVITVGAYASRLKWFYYDSALGGASKSIQHYDDPPLADRFNSFEEGELAYFSSRGPRRDGVGKPDISAPGVGIASSLSHFVRHGHWVNKSKFFEKNIVLPDLEAVVFLGTSMSAPNVAGVVALLLEAVPTLDDEDLKMIFKRTAIRDYSVTTYEAYNPADRKPVEDQVDSDKFTGVYDSFNNDWGFGKIDIGAALAYVAQLQCKADTDCHDGDVCTDDSCGPSGMCVYTKRFACSSPGKPRNSNGDVPIQSGATFGDSKLGSGLLLGLIFSVVCWLTG